MGRVTLDMKQKIVIIESDKVITKILIERLSGEGYIVYTTKSKKRGVKFVREKLPSLILLDISKQEDTELLKYFHDDNALKRIPIIAILDFGKKEKIEKAITFGAVDWITKLEFDINILVKKIKKQIGFP